METLESFDDLVNLGKVTRKVKLMDHEIALETLNSKDYSQAMALVPDNATDAKKFETIQREMISAAIKSIDGKIVSAEIKQKLMSNSQLGLSNILYGLYLAMVEEQGKLLDGAKKNSSPAQMPSMASQKAPDSK